MSGARHWEQDKEATVYIGNLDERISDSLVWELMLQAGRIVNVHLPKDRVTQTHQGYGFVEFISEEDADYAAKVMNQVRLYGKPIRVNKASADKQRNVEVGAELFVGNLDPMVDERALYDTFSRFGGLVAAPKVARDDSNYSKGYAFLSFSTFEASDTAIANMHGQYLMNKEITVQYAYKKDGKGERHGDEAERRLAAQAQKHGVQLPVQPIGAPTFGAPAAAPASQPPPPIQQQQQPPAGFGSGMPNGFNTQPYGNGNFQANNASYPSVPGSGSAQSPAPPPGFSSYPPPPQQQQFARQPPPQHLNNPLPPAPSGLPARPPPSQAGYGGPAGFAAPGFAGQQQNPSFMGGPPPGFPAPPGSAPGMPPGFGTRR